MDFDFMEFFTTITIYGLLTMSVLLAGIDTVWNIALALSHGNFSGLFVTDYLRTHVIKKVLPIAFLGIIGHGVSALDVPPIPPVFTAAVLSLVAYAVNVVSSLRKAMDDTTPVPAIEES